MHRPVGRAPAAMGRSGLKLSRDASCPRLHLARIQSTVVAPSGGIDRRARRSRPPGTARARPQIRGSGKRHGDLLSDAKRVIRASRFARASTPGRWSPIRRPDEGCIVGSPSAPSSTAVHASLGHRLAGPCPSSWLGALVVVEYRQVRDAREGDCGSQQREDRRPALDVDSSKMSERSRNRIEYRGMARPTPSASNRRIARLVSSTCWRARPPTGGAPSLPSPTGAPLAPFEPIMLFPSANSTFTIGPGRSPAGSRLSTRREGRSWAPERRERGRAAISSRRWDRRRGRLAGEEVHEVSGHRSNPPRAAAAGRHTCLPGRCGDGGASNSASRTGGVAPDEAPETH